MSAELSPRVDRPKIRRGISAVRLQDTKGSVHTYSEEEKEGLVDVVNFLLRDDGRLQQVIPIDNKSDDIFTLLKDGILLCKLVNAIKPGTIETSKINDKMELSIFERSENLIVALQGAQVALNMPLVNIGVEDLLEGKQVLVLAILWQLVNLYLHTQIEQTAHVVKLDYLLKDEVDESIDDEQLRILLRWFNHHLREAKHPRRVANLGADIRDSENYAVLLHQLSPLDCTLNQILSEQDLLERAVLLLAEAEKIGCKKFLGPDDIVQGNSRLNFAFLANLFTTFQQPSSPEKTVEPPVLPVKEVPAVKEPLSVHIKEIYRTEQEQIHILEERRRIQDDAKIREIQLLQKELANAKERQSIPSVAELQEAIAKEERETKRILDDKEKLQLKVAALQTKVDASHSATKKVEEEVAKASLEVQKMEEEHNKEVAQLKTKLESGTAAVSALQKKIDEAVQQATALTKTKRDLSRTKEELEQKIEYEEKEVVRQSRARQRLDTELSKAKKSLETTQKNRSETELATTKLERQLQEINDEIVDIKKETIRVEHSTTVIKQDLEKEKDNLDLAKIEKKKLVSRRDELEDEIFESMAKLKQEERATRKLVQEEKAKGQQLLVDFEKRASRELFEYEHQKEYKMIHAVNIAAKAESALIEKTLEEARMQVRGMERKELARQLGEINSELIETEKRNAQLDRLLSKAEKRAQTGREETEEEEKHLQELLQKEKEASRTLAEINGENELLEHKAELLAREMQRMRGETNDAESRAAEAKREARSLQIKLDLERDSVKS